MYNDCSGYTVCMCSFFIEKEPSMLLYILVPFSSKKSSYNKPHTLVDFTTLGTGRWTEVAILESSPYKLISTSILRYYSMRFIPEDKDSMSFKSTVLKRCNEILKTVCEWRSCLRPLLSHLEVFKALEMLQIRLRSPIRLRWWECRVPCVKASSREKPGWNRRV